MTTTLTTTAAWVRDSDVDELQKRVNRVNQRATKLGASPVVLRITGKDRIKTIDRRTRVREVEVEVLGSQPRLPGGWVLLAVMDHREALPIVKSVPGRELPAGQRDRGPLCDRCGKNRRRTDTFVLQDESGKVVQVGRNCLGDFLGAAGDNPERLLLFWTAALGVLDGYDDEGGWGGRIVPRLSVTETVLLSAAVIDQEGWVSKAVAQNENRYATASTVADIIWPRKLDGQAAVEFGKLRDAIEARINDTLRAEATAAIEWAKGHAESDSDYLHNLAALALSDVVSDNKLGLLVSLIASYRREQDRLVEAERRQVAGAASRHVGQVKERMELGLTLTGKPRAFDGDFGTSYLAEFTDGTNLFVWWASSDPVSNGWEIGVERQAKATVKKHESFKGVDRTVVNRVAAVKS